jgi:hypothetical protein
MNVHDRAGRFTSKEPNPAEEELYFWQHVDRAPGYGPRGDCWLWIGTYSPGTIKNGKRDFRPRMAFRCKSILAYRFSFFLFRGRWPTPNACHTCDFSLCVNPRHLFEGGQAENMRDASRKGRCRTRLMASQVAEIRRSTLPGVLLAERFGVSKGQISALRHGKAFHGP